MTGAPDWITQAEMLAIEAREISDPALLCREPVVSVLMMTYNHAPYLEQAVESVLAQQCRFEFEILIGEDHSTDGTRALCEDLQARYPAHIRLIVAEQNVGITANFLRLVARARGTYAAMLEGDDYWTAPDKLQQQVELMERHPDYAWCAGRTANRMFWAEKKPAYSLEDILRRYIFHTSAALFRRALLERYPRFPEVVCLDNLLFGYLSSLGPCGFIDKEVSYYRRHAGGVWTGAAVARRLEMTWACIDALDDYFSGIHRRELVDRELWSYRLDTALSLQPGFWQRWRAALGMLGHAVPRMSRRAPLGFARLAIEIFAQPPVAGWLLLRRKLALGSRVAGLARRKPAGRKS